jgi:bleomycin hydrolase
MRFSFFVWFLFVFFCFSKLSYGQEEKEVFVIEKEIKHLPVINQGSTGTCWSFATTSFLESEIIRKGFEETDLSEMYFVNYAYINKVEKYLLYHGNNNFSQGGQAHDVLDVLQEKGMVTFDDFPGIMVDDKYRHRDLVNELQTAVENINDKKEEFDASDMSSVKPILEKHLGELPKKVKSEKGKFKPKEFAERFELNADDYIEITSFNHHPFYQPFVLEVPDNWSHGLYYNVPVDELVEIIYHSINTGYTVCWDGDTSEKTFVNKVGKADLPKEQIGKVNQELRQQTFLNRTTTDDHLMHIVGLSKDSDGRNCFFTKNSWGQQTNSYGGYIHLTEDYVRLKTIAIMVHKEAIPADIRTKLNL